MTIPKEGSFVAPVRRANTTLKVTLFITTAIITSAVSFIGAVIAMQGGDIWPWVWVLVVLYGVELGYAGIAVVLHHLSPQARKQRDFYKRRQAARTPL